MKKVILLSVFAAFFFSACEKNLYDADLAEAKKTIKDLVVPQDFDWEMTQTVTVNLTSPVEVAVEVYTNAACTDAYRIISYTVIPGVDMPVEVSVPAGISKLYVKYESVIESVSIVNNKADLVLAATKAATTRGWGNGSNEKPMYVSKPWSTLMFEDFFPALGDYDFNDFVANYRYSIVYTVSANGNGNGNGNINLNSSHIDGYEFEFRVNAIGATKPITPYLRISTKNPALKELFTSAKNLEVSSSNSKVKAEIILNGDDYTVIKFTGMTDKASNVFVNTESDKELTGPLTIKVEVHTASNQGFKWDDAYSANSLDFEFFITNGSTEIHKRGYAPVLGSYPLDIEKGTGKEYYSNSDNLVWAIDVPKAINHAIETINFLEAYPQFKAWATSGGTQNQNWYEAPNNNLLIDFMSKYGL